jgi:hypothetical protein
MRFKLEDLHAHLAPLDSYGLPGLTSAMTDGVRALARGLKGALRGVLCCGEAYGVPHSQREQATPPMLNTVVKHMATLAQGPQTVIGGIMVKVRSRQRHPCCANSGVVAHSSSQAGQSPSASVAPSPLVFVPPSTIA